MRRAAILSAALVSASFGATAGFATMADAKPIAITYQLEVTDQVEAQPTFSALKKDAAGAPAVLQVAHPAAAVRLVGPATFETDSAGPIAAVSGTMFVSAASSAGTLFCRAFSQTAEKERGEHAGVCLHDSNGDGAFDQQFESNSKAMTAFDIRRVGGPRAIGPVRYVALEGEKAPRTDIIVRPDVNYGPAIGAEPRPLSMGFLAYLSMPGELLTENWADRHWPVIQFDAKGNERLVPRSNPVSFAALKPAQLGPFTLDVSGEPSALALKAEGAIAPGRYDLRGDFDAKMGVAETRRIFKLIPAHGVTP